MWKSASFSRWKWDIIACDSVVSPPLYKAVNIGYESTAYELSVCESDSRCSSWTTKARLKLLIFTSARHGVTVFGNFKEACAVLQS